MSGALIHKGLLLLERVPQDGMWARASASAPSFRGEVPLLDCRKRVELHVKGVEAEIQTVRELCGEGRTKPRA